MVGTTLSRVWQVLRTVPDPEIPAISLFDLGIIRYVKVDNDGVEIGVSPTYSGCPATEVIRGDITAAVQNSGIERVSVVAVLTPPWTSDWITPQGREHLRRYGIAPPPIGVGNLHDLLAAPACPRCQSQHTQRTSEFGSTPCKALYRCNDCREPFEHFKCI
jgi:ring-1,2-phenylacetyl-CoA epoxidase subunit PaaD